MSVFQNLAPALRVSRSNERVQLRDREDYSGRLSHGTTQDFLLRPDSAQRRLEHDVRPPESTVSTPSGPTYALEGPIFSCDSGRYGRMRDSPSEQAASSHADRFALQVLRPGRLVVVVAAGPANNSHNKFPSNRVALSLAYFSLWLSFVLRRSNDEVS